MQCYISMLMQYVLDITLVHHLDHFWKNFQKIQVELFRFTRNFIKKSFFTDAKLLSAKDTHKDQTFFLSQIAQRALKRTMFPLGDFLKKDVKNIATDAGLDRISRKKESTGICFVGKRNFNEFIKEVLMVHAILFILILIDDFFKVHPRQTGKFY